MRKEWRLALIGVLLAFVIVGAAGGGYYVARKTIFKAPAVAGGSLPVLPTDRIGNYALTITSQQDDATISNPVTVSGTGTIPAGQTVTVRLRDSQGNEIAATDVPFNGGYSATLRYNAPTASAAQLEVVALDPQTQVPVAGTAIRVSIGSSQSQ